METVPIKFVNMGGEILMEIISSVIPQKGSQLSIKNSAVIYRVSDVNYDYSGFENRAPLVIYVIVKES